MKFNPRLNLILTMMLFGTIGTISRFINMPSSIICLVRALVGAIIILIFLKATGRNLDGDAIKSNIVWLILGAVILCINWICQFEAFKYTTVATGTLCYYMQPIFYILMSALILKEHVSVRKWFCVLAAFAGMILVSGVIQVGFNWSELKGVLYGIAGGFFYAVVVLINKYMKDISPIDTTVMQMSIVTVFMIPYTALTHAYSQVSVTATGIICLLVLGIVHTGIAYVIYFDCVNKLSAQTVGILSYIDPVEACLLSAFFLHEGFTVYTILGATLILGATAVSELSGRTLVKGHAHTED